MCIDLPILTLLQEPLVVLEQKVYPLPRMYALSKTGSIRVYDITVEDMGDHAVMTTRKKVTLNGKWTEDKYEYWEGVNIGKANETTYLEQALSEAQSAWNRLRDAGFTALTLGSRILRWESAALMALGLHWWGRQREVFFCGKKASLH